MDHRFAYRAKVVNVVVSLVLGIPMVTFGVLALSSGWSISRRGTVLSDEVAMGLFILILVTGAWLSAFGVRQAMAGSRVVVVAPTHLDLPASVASRRIERIPVGAIKNVVVQNDPVNGLGIMVVTQQGKPFRLPKNAFEDDEAFEACLEAIKAVRGSGAV